jgi:DNA replication protein DnaC
MMREQTFDKLYRMKLHGMAQALEEQFRQPDMEGLAFDERLAMLVDAQWLWRENRALATRLRSARLKQQGSIEDINFRHPRQLDRSVLRSLSACDWVRERHNLVITGPSGIGKTFICCALLHKACREGFSALYFPAEKFFRALALAYADGSFDRLLTKIARVDVLAIDDWGIVPMGDRERRHLLEVLEDRNQERSTVVTSQFPVENWHEVVGSPTLADSIIERFLTRAHRIEMQGGSLRPLARSREPKEVES